VGRYCNSAAKAFQLGGRDIEIFTDTHLRKEDGNNSTGKEEKIYPEHLEHFLQVLGKHKEFASQ